MLSRQWEMHLQSDWQGSVTPWLDWDVGIDKLSSSRILQAVDRIWFTFCNGLLVLAEEDWRGIQGCYL